MKTFFKKLCWSLAIAGWCIVFWIIVGGLAHAFVNLLTAGWRLESRF